MTKQTKRAKERHTVGAEVRRILPALGVITNREAALVLRDRLPGSAVTAKSVASTASRIRREPEHAG